MGMGTSVERSAAVDNFVKVFGCKPEEQAKRQLEQMIGGGKKEYQKPEVKEMEEGEVAEEVKERLEQKWREGQGEMNRQLVHQAEEAEKKVLEMAREKRKVEETVGSLLRGNEELQGEVRDCKEANKEMAAVLKKAEGELGDLRIQLEMTRGALGVASDKAGIKADNRGHRNLIQRVEELVEKEKELLRQKGKKGK